MAFVRNEDTLRLWGGALRVVNLESKCDLLKHCKAAPLAWILRISILDFLHHKHCQKCQTPLSCLIPPFHHHDHRHRHHNDLIIIIQNDDQVGKTSLSPVFAAVLPNHHQVHQRGHHHHLVHYDEQQCDHDHHDDVVQVAGFNSLADVLKRLDFTSAIRDVRRFQWVFSYASSSTLHPRQ